MFCAISPPVKLLKLRLPRLYENGEKKAILELLFYCHAVFISAALPYFSCFPFLQGSLGSLCLGIFLCRLLKNK